MDATLSASALFDRSSVWRLAQKMVIDHHPAIILFHKKRHRGGDALVTIRNQPSCSNSSRFRTLQAKKAMFNLNENNRIVMSQHPSDMRIGVNGMCGQVRKVGLDPSNGDVYIFVGRSRQLMKILHWERGGYVMYYKRLEQGRFHPRIFLREGIGFRTMRWDELVLLMEGISPKVARRKRFPNPNGKLELSRKK